MQLDDFTINCILLFYLFPQHFGPQNVVRTSVIHLTAPRVPFFYSFHILMLSVIYMYYCTDSLQHGIYFFKFIFF